MRTREELMDIFNNSVNEKMEANDVIAVIGGLQLEVLMDIREIQINKQKNEKRD